jgi:hypothetical protein
MDIVRSLPTIVLGLCMFACGNSTLKRSGSDASTSVSSDGIVVDSSSTAEVTNTCTYQACAAPVLLEAAQFGASARFVAMASAVVQYEMYAEAGKTDHLVRVPPPPYEPTVLPISNLAQGMKVRALHSLPDVWPPGASPVEIEQAVFCDEQSCLIYVNTNDVLVRDTYPPAPWGEWDELFPSSLPSHAVEIRGRGRLCSSTGAEWTCSRLSPDFTPAVPACLSARAIVLDKSWRSTIYTGVDSLGALLTVESGNCCETWNGLQDAIDVHSFQYGEEISMWVLTPGVLFGTYLTGHD